MAGSHQEQIHKASVKLLQDPGIRIEHEEICKLLLDNGAAAGSSSDVIKIPEKMINDCLALAPKSFELASSGGKSHILSADGDSTFWSCPGMNIQEGKNNRPYTSKDMSASAKLLEKLPEIDVVFGMALSDIKPALRDVVGLKLMAENTSKHIRVLCFSPEGADKMLQMKPVISNKAWFSIGFTAHGPLRWTNLALEIFKRTAGGGIPVTINGEPMAGVSGPVTLAGSCAVGNAEILAGLVINQLLEPGRPCIYNLGLAHVFDMKTSIAVTGGPENALFAKAAAEMGRFYNLPSCSWVSTESMCADSQAAMEKMFGIHTHMENGVSAIWGMGQLESELT
ncbi:MAG: trimethylamine methyltransferase family protein, partial [Planctomycetota bacterium]